MEIDTPHLVAISFFLMGLSGEYTGMIHMLISGHIWRLHHLIGIEYYRETHIMITIVEVFLGSPIDPECFPIGYGIILEYYVDAV